MNPILQKLHSSNMLDQVQALYLLGAMTPSDFRYWNAFYQTLQPFYLFA